MKGDHRWQGGPDPAGEPGCRSIPASQPVGPHPATAAGYLGQHLPSVISKGEDELGYVPVGWGGSHCLFCQLWSHHPPWANIGPPPTSTSPSRKRGPRWAVSPGYPVLPRNFWFRETRWAVPLRCTELHCRQKCSLDSPPSALPQSLTGSTGGSQPFSAPVSQMQFPHVSGGHIW